MSGSSAAANSAPAITVFIPTTAKAIGSILADFDRRVLLTYAPGQFEAVPQGGARIRDVAAWKQQN